MKQQKKSFMGLKEVVRKLKRRFKASLRRRKYLSLKRKKKRKEKKFISQVLADASGTLDREYRLKGVDKVKVRGYSKDEYNFILKHLDEINERGKNFYDPIEILIYYLDDKEEDEFSKNMKKVYGIKFPKDTEQTEIWVRYLNGRTKP